MSAKLTKFLAGMGEVTMNWIGASYQDFLTEKALDILASYLSDSAISPLQKQLIEINDPWATGLGLDSTDYSTAILQLSLSSVPTARLDKVAEAVKDTLRRVLKTGIDMDRMTMILNREQRKVGTFYAVPSCLTLTLSCSS